MDYINKYREEMGSAGIDDNLRNYYRIYIWVRKRNWWRYILFWAVGVTSRMHKLYTYAFITCTVLKGNIDYVATILERKYHVHG